MAITDLAAVTIHDVKNRLAAMAARAERRGDTETLREALGAAADLSRLLALYKADAGLLRADIDARCPAELLDELAAETQPLTALDIRLDSRLAPACWFYDEALARMVLANALHNALRFARREVRLTARESGDWLEFQVSDDGPGYPPEMLAEATLPTPISASGTGVGLHLARRVAALHENHGVCGRLTLSNAGGAVFSLLLPR